MAWLPSGLGKSHGWSRNRCLICNQEQVHKVDGPTVKKMEVICHLLHVNWDVLSHEVNGKYLLCSSCSKLTVELNTVWEELQLIEHSLRNRVAKIRNIVEQQYGVDWKAGTREAQRHLTPNSLQIHFIEESRSRDLMRAKLAEQPNSIPVEPSLVQLHINPDHRLTHSQRLITLSETSQNGKPLTKEPTIPIPASDQDHNDELIDVEHDLPITPNDIKQRRSSFKSKQNTSKMKSNSESESDSQHSSDPDFEDYQTSGSEEENEDNIEMTVTRKNLNLRESALDPEPVTGKQLMSNVHKRWQLDKHKDGKMFFRGIEIIKKPVKPEDATKHRFLVECGICGKQFYQLYTRMSSIFKMKIHIAANHLGSFRCEPCGKDYSCSRALSGHLTTVLHARGNPQDAGLPLAVLALPKLEHSGVTVSKRGKIRYSDIEIIMSQEQVENNDFTLTCSKCQLVVNSMDTFKRKRNPWSVMIKHIKVKHKGIYACRICDKKYTDPRSVETHFRYHHTLEAPLNECTICGKLLRHVCSLKRHIWTHRNQAEIEAAIASGENPPHTYKTYIKRRRERLGYKDSYQCSECGKTFELMCSLKRHEETHNPKVYVCAVCGMEFRTPQLRWKHSAEAHQCKKKGRIFYCKFCPASFKGRRRNAYKNHMEQHSSKLPYTCPHCPAGFALEVSLITHLKKCRVEKIGLDEFSKEVYEEVLDDGVVEIEINEVALPQIEVIEVD